MADILGMLELSGEKGQLVPSVLKTSAMKGDGIQDLVSMLLQHRKDEQQIALRRQLGVREEILNLVKDEIFLKVRRKLEKDGELQNIIKQVIEKKMNPYIIVQELLQRHRYL